MISIVIPTFNESQRIDTLISYLEKSATDNALTEIIVVDGGSTDDTVEKVLKTGARLLTSPGRGRAIQMNYAVEKAKGDTIYFVHADTKPPKSYCKHIIDAVAMHKRAGCFTSVFDWNHPFLRFCNFFSRLPFWFCRGGGQTLFVERFLFYELNGFDEDMKLMEEYDFISRLKKKTTFEIINKNAVTSARDYRANGAVRLQLIYAYIFLLYAFGASQDKMLSVVRKYVNKA